MSTCKRCTRPLTNPDSCVVEYGPLCYRITFGKPLKKKSRGKTRNIRIRTDPETMKTLNRVDEMFR